MRLFLCPTSCQRWQRRSLSAHLAGPPLLRGRVTMCPFPPWPRGPGAPMEPVRASAQLALLSHPAWTLITSLLSCDAYRYIAYWWLTVSVITFMACCHVLWSAYLPPPAHAGIDPKSTKLIGISETFWIFKSSFCILCIFCSLYWFVLCSSPATFSWLATERQLYHLSFHLSALCYTSQLLLTSLVFLQLLQFCSNKMAGATKKMLPREKEGFCPLE